MVDEDLVIDIDELDLHDMGEDSSGDEEAEDPAAAVGAAAVTVSVAAEVKEQVGVPVENNDIVETVVKKDVVGEIIDGAIEVKEEVEGTKDVPPLVVEVATADKSEEKELNSSLNDVVVEKVNDTIQAEAEVVEKAAPIVIDPEAMKELEQLRTATDFYEFGATLLLRSRTEGAAKSAEIAKENYLKAFGKNRTPLSLKTEH